MAETTGLVNEVHSQGYDVRLPADAGSSAGAAAVGSAVGSKVGTIVAVGCAGSLPQAATITTTNASNNRSGILFFAV